METPANTNTSDTAARYLQNIHLFLATKEPSRFGVWALLCTRSVKKAVFILFRPPVRYRYCCIPGVPGGNVNSLGGHNIGHSKHNGLHEPVSYSERFPR